CGATIARIKLSGRSSHFCPQCQVSTVISKQ
ncbi:zinc finger domain-containing protein, partial [Microcystis sp.]